MNEHPGSASGGSTAALDAKPIRRWGLVLGALGVVFGDIGTSPIYALRECLAALHDLKRLGVPLEPASTSFYFNREIVSTFGRTRMPGWQKKLYRFLSRNSEPVHDHFRVPSHQIIELGLTVAL